jgi:ribosomal protein L12E/L44/L45/RPP1/RPP2
MASRKSKTALKAEPAWERTPREVEAIEKACSGRFEGVPRLHVSKSEKGLSITTEHRDGLAGKALLMEAIATTDADFFVGFVNQLAEAGGGEVDEQRLNFLLAVVKGIKPRDQMEAMLAAQMAAVHTAAMKSSRCLAEADHLDHRDSAERTFNKLTRTYVTQMEALKRYRTGGEQTVTVQHVNVGEGGQAIVGNVTQGQQDVPSRMPAQPLALTHDQNLAMAIIESKEAVPVPAPRNAKKK